MENGSTFMPNYLQMASFFVIGETLFSNNQHFLAVCKCVNFNVGILSSVDQTFGQI